MFNNFVILSSKAVMSYYVYLHQSNMKAFPCVQVEYIYIYSGNAVHYTGISN